MTIPTIGKQWKLDHHGEIQLMEEILHQVGICSILSNWCRISSINSIHTPQISREQYLHQQPPRRSCGPKVIAILSSVSTAASWPGF